MDAKDAKDAKDVKDVKDVKDAVPDAEAAAKAKAKADAEAQAAAKAVEADREAVLAAMAKMRALTPVERAKLGLASGTGEEVEHAMWGAAERFMGMRSSGVEYESRTFRCRVAMGDAVFEWAPGAPTTFVAGLALPLGWKAPGFVRRVEFGWPGGPRLASWSLGDTREHRSEFDGATLDFYARSFASASVRAVLGVNQSTTSRLVDDEYGAQCWDSYARRTLYVWFAEPVPAPALRGAAPLEVRVSYYRPVFDSESSGDEVEVDAKAVKAEAGAKAAKDAKVATAE